MDRAIPDTEKGLKAETPKGETGKPPVADNGKKPEEKKARRKLTGEETYRLFNIHLRQKLLKQEEEALNREEVILKLKWEIYNLQKEKVDEELKAEYAKLGLKIGQRLDIMDDGTIQAVEK